MATPNDSRRSTPSLLLQPPTSGFSWDTTAGNSFFLPVIPPEESTADVESDSFIGQGPVPSPASNLGGLSGLSSHSAFKPIVSMTSASPLSQLQQPLRPIQSQTPPNVIKPDVISPQPAFEGPPPIGLPPTGPLNGPPPFSGPPTGPAQNFRRQAPLAYAQMPDYSGAQQTVYNPHQVPQETGPPPPSLPAFQTYTPTYSQYEQQQQHQQTAPPVTEPYYGNPIAGAVPQTGFQTAPSMFSNYKPVQSHWFYRKEVEKKELWIPFSVVDSTSLEEAYKNGDNADCIIPTDGGRYDVYLGERLRKSVYWDEPACSVKRSSWFYKAEGQNRYVPYDEVIADRIEEFYRLGVTQNRWPQKMDLEGEAIVLQNPQEVAHYLPSKLPDEWGYVPEGQMTLRVVKRGVTEILTVEEGETRNVDHLVFLVQGVGAVCDLKFRSVVECVDDFRSMSLSLTRSHFGSALSSHRIGRVEVLPIAWHASLHGDATGIDSKMQTITLQSIPKLRHFTNDTVMDIFFYTSPVYCQTIVDTVGSELNRIFRIFTERNPSFKGGVSVAGHSLGSLILFDILAHQLDPNAQPPVRERTPTPPPQPPTPPVVECAENSLETVFEKLGLAEYASKFEEEKIDLETLKFCSENDIKEMGLPMGPRKKLVAYLKEVEERLEADRQRQACKSNAVAEEIASPASSNCEGLPWSRASLVNRQDSITSINYMIGVAGTGQPSVVYPKLTFQPATFFALGSPISMFLTVRGIQTIGEEYQLPTCPAFFNIFHPYDPVAFRMETLIDPNLDIKPVQIPHHKGRKRLHLELRDSLARVGTDLKQKLIDSVRTTWNSISDFARAHRSSAEQIEAELDRVVQEQLDEQRKEMEEAESTATNDVANQEDIQIGQLNGGRRIDYVLQEKPIESFNQYLFALASHTCYWESEDTALLMLKEVYSLSGVYPESTQNSPNSGPAKLTLYNPAAAAINNSRPTFNNEYPPMAPGPGYNKPAHLPSDTYPPVAMTTGPPPLQGFVRSSPLVKR